MTDRDQLAALIRANVSNVRGLGIEGEHEGWLWESDSGEPLPDAVADAIIAAGWRPCNGRHWVKAPKEGFGW